MGELSRRDFVAGAGTFASALAVGQTGTPLTAGVVIERIRQHVGVPWREQTVDKLLTGTADTRVRGIATTMMATLDVLERCAAAGTNLIISHETPFYLHQDITADIKEDAVLQHKLEFCRLHDLAMFHFHDHWHARRPDGIAQGMVEQLGWQKYVTDPTDPTRLTFDGRTLAGLTQQMQATLGARTMRVLGDPALPVRQVETSWGFCGREGGIRIFSDPGVDVLICGETREWELVEYCQDSIRMGNRKALIVVGHVLSEQGGMRLCRDWMQAFVPETKVEFVAAAEPFWNPEHPPRSVTAG